MMGAQLVARVFAHWTHLPDRPFRLLTYMAHITKDTNAAPTFYGGRSSLVGALGITSDGPSAERMVSRAVSVLVDAGALKRTYLGHAGKRSEYLLTLDRFPPKGDSAVTQKGDCGVGVRVTVESEKGDSGVPARVTVESSLGTTEEKGRKTLGASHSVTDVSGTRATAPVRGKASDSRLALVRERADAEAAS